MSQNNMNMIVAFIIHNNKKKVLVFIKLFKSSLDNGIFAQFRKNFKRLLFHSGGFPEQKIF